MEVRPPSRAGGVENRRKRPRVPPEGRTGAAWSIQPLTSRSRTGEGEAGRKLRGQPGRQTQAGGMAIGSLPRVYSTVGAWPSLLRWIVVRPGSTNRLVQVVSVRGVP